LFNQFFPQRETCENLPILHGSEETPGGFLSNFYISRPAMPPPGREKRIMTARAPSTCAQLHQLLRVLNMDPWIEDRGWK